MEKKKQKQIKIVTLNINVSKAAAVFKHQGRIIDKMKNLMANSTAKKTLNNKGNTVVSITDTIESNLLVTKYYYYYIFI